ncbi:translation initiation factor IF-2, mitochondrial isoform X2 [Agrilus planipennis]|uniref:Translation initiation factor IF-2, mitochondrial n=1 Tax=Agrilus planipennis TaxID=224129 RepID=A0A1W4XKQ0_AGRPL|nr:translation initiation factor IF-2, mitochondrial isoform X3 [Agrilus planipennis]XP_025830247.1 translation initiation factor IF-2, mitochondrial isoform X1 [Agrilus planipennis]XP_025830248.1 translation initiation factor IF-2, mitochondrial isoform X2 [Agrilus planipennis]
MAFCKQFSRLISLKNLIQARALHHPFRKEVHEDIHKRVWIVFLTEHSLHTSNCIFKRRKTNEERKAGAIKGLPPKSKAEVISIWPNITASELSEVLNSDLQYVYDIFLGSVNKPYQIISNMKELQLALHRAGKRMRIIGKPKNNIEKIKDADVYPRPPAPKSALKPRPPIVTVMGHVDHGKTTLLDALRQSNVVQQEFGGITQHIGAFSVTLFSGAKVTFLDTPGHAAFTSMRARGANITDIVVLVVAADDGVMEQTLESIRMAREARVPILVAINKIDSHKADVERTEQMLVEAGIQVERLGGDVQAVPISALKQVNLDKLTEALVLQAEVMEIGADPTGPVEATVIDSKIHKYRGRLCTVVVQRGTLKKGDILIADTCFAKVRALKDEKGNILESVAPGFPAEIEGWRDLPPAGELVLQVDSEKRAKSAIRAREEKKELKRAEEDLKYIKEKEEQHLREYKKKLQLKQKIGRRRLKSEGPRKPEIAPESGPPTFHVVVKGDVDGTVEAILDTLDTYESEDVKLSLIHFDVGSVTENDVELAEMFKGTIYAFNVDIPLPIQQMADNVGVPVKKHNVIYKLIDDVKEEINSRLPPKEVEEILGEATALQQFFINEKRKKVAVAGCRCIKGFLKKSAKYRVKRKDEVIFEGSLASMRHLKEEVDTIKNNMECGLLFSDKDFIVEPGDIIICYEKRLEPQKSDWDPGF